MMLSKQKSAFLEEMKRKYGDETYALPNRPRMLRFFAKKLWDLVRNSRIEKDPCNIVLTTPLGVFNYRNPYCTKTKLEEPKGF